MTTPSEHTSPAMQRILALLARKSDMSASDMSREAFVGVTTLACGGYLKALRAKRLVHVSGWRKTRKGFVTPLFSLGDHPDLPRPRFEDEDRDSAGLGQIVDRRRIEERAPPGHPGRPDRDVLGDARAVALLLLGPQRLGAIVADGAFIAVMLAFGVV